MYSDSKLLSEIDHPKFTEREIVQIAIDLTNILIELQSIGQGISLRNIQAGNVIVTPCEGGYMAGIVNMETAKIQGYMRLFIRALSHFIFRKSIYAA